MATSDQKQKKGRYLSLRFKIWFGFLLIFIPLFLAGYLVFHQYVIRRMLAELAGEIAHNEAAVDAIIGLIKEEDVDNFVALYQEESAGNPQCPPALGAQENGYYPENPRYLEHENLLASMQALQPGTRMYTYIKGTQPGEIIAIGSTGYFRNPRGGLLFCQRYTDKRTRMYDGLFYQVDEWRYYVDAYGNWISSYVPIKDQNGQIVGAIGIDLPSDDILRVIYNMTYFGLGAFGVSFLVMFILVYIVSGVVTRSLTKLAAVAEQIGVGNYNQELPASQGKIKDEIDTLADVFRVMVDKVYQRERFLRERVQQLEIMIDDAKREKEVQSIVESDFFQELQAKAKTIRERYSEEIKRRKG